MPHYFENGFFVRQPAWHGLGNVLEHPPTTIKEALELSGLDWEVQKRKLFFVNSKESYTETEKFALVRSDNERILGYTKKQYEPFQNKSALEWCQPLIATELWDYETAGSLRDGEVCWALLKHDETEIVPNDVLKQYLLVNWNHTGKKSNVIRPVSIRVVCNNTLTTALQGTNATDKIYHRGDNAQRYSELQRYYVEVTKQFTRQHAMFEKLLFDMTSSQLEEYCDKVFPTENTELSGKALSISKNSAIALKEMVVDGRASGARDLGIVNTGYGAFNATQEYFEYYHGGGRIQDRATAVLEGNLAKDIDRALNLVMEFANN